MIMRFGNSLKELMVLEAVADKGVRMIQWMKIRAELYENGFFNKICIRKLVANMTDERLKNLDNFRKNCFGKEYGIKVKDVIWS